MLLRLIRVRLAYPKVYSDPIWPRSPKAANAIPIEERFNGNEDQIAGQCLGDEHSVERVAVRTRQGPSAHRVL